jgi:hypothetical protein
MVFILKKIRSLNTIVAQLKNGPFGFNNKTEQKNITTTYNNNDISQVMFQLTNVLVMSDVVLKFLAYNTINSKWQILGCTTIAFCERFQTFLC